MIDETGPAGAQTASADKTINTEGSNEQWRRHLEKACFERQRAAMPGAANARPQAAAVRTADVGDANAPATAEISESAAAGRPGGAAAEAPGHPAVARASAVAHNPVARASMPSPPGNVARDQTFVQTQRQDAGAPAPSAKPGANWRGALPASSSASVLLTEKGAHLVIRDASLSATDARKLLRRLPQLFAAEGQRLWAVTLNGERLWQASAGTRAEGPAAGTELIDRKY